MILKLTSHHDRPNHDWQRGPVYVNSDAIAYMRRVDDHTAIAVLAPSMAQYGPPEDRAFVGGLDGVDVVETPETIADIIAGAIKQ